MKQMQVLYCLHNIVLLILLNDLQLSYQYPAMLNNAYNYNRLEVKLTSKGVAGSYLTHGQGWALTIVSKKGQMHALWIVCLS